MSLVSFGASSIHCNVFVIRRRPCGKTSPVFASECPTYILIISTCTCERAAFFFLSNNPFPFRETGISKNNSSPFIWVTNDLHGNIYLKWAISPSFSEAPRVVDKLCHFNYININISYWPNQISWLQHFL